MQVDNDEGHDLSRWTGNVELSDEIEAKGITTDLKAGVIGGYYSIQKKPAAATTKTDDLGRVTPMASVEWRSPISVPQRRDPVCWSLDCNSPMSGAKTRQTKFRTATLPTTVLMRQSFPANHQGYDYLRPGTRADVGVSALSEDALRRDFRFRRCKLPVVRQAVTWADRQ